MNSPIKPPAQNVNKDGTPNLGRRTSISHNQNTVLNNETSTGRPGTRRRDSGDLLRSGNSLASPTSRFSRDDPEITSPSTLTRRRTDTRDTNLSLVTEDSEQSNATKDRPSPFAALKRTATGPTSAGINGPSSPWTNASQSAHLSNTGNFGSFTMAPGSGPPLTPGERKSRVGSFRSESRFRGLMSNESVDENHNRMREKGSLSSLERLLESTGEQTSKSLDSPRAAQPRRFPAGGNNDGSERTGSAALGGDDASLSQPDPVNRTGPNAQSSYEDIGFSSLDQPPDPSPRYDFSSQTAHRGHQTSRNNNEPPSPTVTNPYQSPQASGAGVLPKDLDLSDSEDYSGNQNAMGPRNLQSRMENMSLGDRSQSSSTGPARQFPNLGGFSGISNLGGTGPWSAAPGPVGTSGRAYPPSSFAGGDSILGSLDNVGSPHHQGSRFFDGGTAGPFGISRQLEQNHTEPDTFQQRYAVAPGAGRTVRDTDSPMRSGRGLLDDLFTNLDNRRGGSQMNDPNAMRSAHPTQGSFSGTAIPIGTPTSGWPSNSYLGRSQEQEPSTPATQPPNAQQRQMVMPDRMKWIYRDPSGNTQGPWSGLEMHDWYKAGFFSPELQVKKLEDTDYEPLAQLIRRIGNSREPFLVPQIGIPHGPATANATATGAVGSSAPLAGPGSNAPPASAQPPFASSFPSFGTTLTAEQQNALERRKQEEQYLMARQKEHLQQQQVIAKMSMHNQQLHHHSSAHSLQSQPSYGSITSPSAYQPPMGPIQPPSANTNFFDPARSVHPLGPGVGSGLETLGPVREDDARVFIERVNAQRGGQAPYGGPIQNPNQMEGMTQQKQVNAMLQDQLYLQQKQDRYSAMQTSNEDLRGHQRLEEFRALQAGRSDELATQSEESRPVSQHQPESQQALDLSRHTEDEPMFIQNQGRRPQSLSLREQVQEAASATSTQEAQSPWSKVPSGMPQPFPPAPSTSPLPAPSAQRNRQHVADALNADLRSSPETPSAGTPSANVAPWAKENNESAKGPSLKEIQAMEAKKAAQAEELVAAQRRAQAEEERRNQPASVAPAPGLPSSAKWASGVPPAVPATTARPWAKGGNSTTPSAAITAGAKKTLAQIQKEEEARKQRTAAQVAVANPPASGATAPFAGGKRYAELASKTVPIAPQVSNNIWTTVGAGGKVKTPGAAPAPVSRNVSGAAVAPVASTKAKPATSAKQIAHDELQKWTRNALHKGLNSSIAGSSLG